MAIGVHGERTEHIAHRPSWDCLACGKDWPCDPAREALAVELDSVRLAMYMWCHLEEAAPDLKVSMGDIFIRFIAWTGPPPALCHGAPAHFEADCGHPGPHGEHPLNQQP